MALQIHNFCRPINPAPIRSLPAKQSTVSGDLHRSVSLKNLISSTPRKKSRSSVTVRSSSVPSAAVVVGEVTEVGNDTFWPIVNAAGDKTVVLDMYTQWCGPCKIMAPKFQELAENHLDVVFLKLNCNKENKHKFTGNNKRDLNAYKVHDSYRHRRILSAVDLPLGGDDSPSSAALYFTKIQIGTPPRDYHVQVDTGSDLLWVNCAGCQSCPKESDLGIPLSLYDPKLSSTSRMITCDQDYCTSTLDSYNDACYTGMKCTYIVRYGDGSSTKGYFVRDNVQLNRVSGNLQTANMKGTISFGCGARQAGGLGTSQQALDGILGFGQSNSSIISQLALAKKVKKTFSHCLSGSKGGIFAIGEVVEPKVSNTTPIMPNDAHFNIELMAIEVGDDFVHIPSEIFNTASKRETIIDSGTTLAYFPDEMYNQLIKQIMANQPTALGYFYEQFQCYRYRGNIDDGFPVVTFHFANSLKLKVHPHQYLFRHKFNHDWCFGFLSNGVQPKEGRNVILLGDFVLADRLVTYNMEDKTIGWTDYDCSSNIKVKDEETGRVYDVGAHDISWSGHTHRSFFIWFVFLLVIKMVMY